MRNKFNLILIHVTGAILFLLVPILISPDLNSPELFKIAPFQIDFISYALLLLFFYVHFFVLIPQFYFKEKKLIYILAILLSYALVSYLPLPLTNHSIAFYGNNFPYYLGHCLFKFLSVFIFSLMIKINIKLKQAEKDKLNAELSFLKAQINPHFLFNTLNSIYSLAITERAQETSAGIIKLSDMMRYISSATDKHVVALTKELNYISNYVELQRKRFGDTVKITYSITGDGKDREIVPLILIPFVENAFKHGINSEEDSVIEIRILITETDLELHVFNNKVKVLHEEELASGLGIANTKNRLQLVYPDKHLLKIENTAKFFSVELKLNLQ